jgi:hypothetical protein
MHKSIEILKALLSRKASIDYIHKTRVSITPADITELSHN